MRKKIFIEIREGDVLLGCEILGSCCDVVVLGSTLFWDVTQQPRLRTVLLDYRLQAWMRR